MSLKDEDGGSAVEFALVSPLLFLILFGVVEFGILLYNQAVITNASREGARYGIVSSSERHTSAEIAEEVALFSNKLIDLSGATPVVSVTVDPPDTAGAVFGQDLTVRVQWQHTFLIIPRLSALNNLMISAETVMKYE
jgi:Flp pilus assembly protein TadG